MSLYQKGVFVIKGLREFTKSGYQAASKSFVESDLNKDASGLVFMITGANSGIGKAAAIAIAKKGGEVHMVCRSLDRANKAKDEIIDESKNQNVHVHILDMSQSGEVYKFADSFSADHGKLNVLVNNAGCMVLERKLIGEVETNFATNTLGTYILTKQLTPLLLRSEQPRVITVSSGGMYIQKLNANDMQLSKLSPFDGEVSYAQQKRHQVILTEELAKQHPNIHFSSMHPGWADTPAVQNSMPDFHRRMQGKFRTPEEGADTIVWLALSEAALKQPTGSFFLDRRPQSLHLPLAWTRESKQDRAKFLKELDELAEKLKPK
ncbi:dehydrogenase/reductase SDR family member 12-like [Clavelina lepadiformis]|uniref:Dehydrogenase/reductase SDR family member 12 n=1 Tax=Clavelina lepadiformis TaxID=159417 RepID=A0ABP0FLW1_CLALP